MQDADALISRFWTTVRDVHHINHDVMLLDGVQSVVVCGVSLVIINVLRASRGDKPIRVYDRKQKRFVAFVRRGEGDHPANEDDLRLMSYDGVPNADRRPLDSFGIGSLNANAVARYRAVFAAGKPQSPWNSDSDEDFLYHIGALAKG